MGRLIDADVLIAELKESALHHCNNSREDCLLQRDRVIVRAQPTVEAIPKDQYEQLLIKYQRIEQILKDIPYGGDATVRRIQEVIEDGID